MPAQNPGRTPLAALTSLRFFAASYVLLFHTRGGVWFRSGYTGVTLFFVLSGFILAYNYPAVEPGQRLRFYGSRLARIYPLYFVSYFAMIPYTYSQEMASGSMHLVKSTVLYFFLLQTWFPPYYHAISAGSWTMPVEAFFYLLFPFVVVWMAKLQRYWILAVLALWIVFLIPALVSDLFWIPTHPASESILHPLLSAPIFHLGEFLVGILLGQRFLSHRPVFSGLHVIAALLLCFASLAVLGIMPISLVDVTFGGLMAVPYGILIFALAGWPSRLLANPVLLIGGEISYSMYLLQWVLVDLVQRTIHHARGFVFLRFVAFCVLAFVSYNLIEKPGRMLLLRLFRIRSHPKPIETREALP